MEGCDYCGRSSYMHKRTGSGYEEGTRNSVSSVFA